MDSSLCFYASSVALFFATLLSWKMDNNKSRSAKISAIALLIAYSLAVGFRSESIGTDTSNYIALFSDKSNMGVEVGDPEWIFYKGATYIYESIGVQWVFASISIIYCTLLALTCAKYSNSNFIPCLIGIYTSFSFYVGAVNIIRAGLSVAILLLASYYAQNSLKRRSDIIKMLALGYVATSIHSASIVFCILIFLALIPIQRAILISIYIACSGISILPGQFIGKLNFIQDFIESISPRAAGYVLDATSMEYKTGFRFDFWIYITLNMLIANYFSKKIQTPRYRYLHRLLIFASALFVLSFQIAFSDRIGFFAFLLIPFMWTIPLSEDYPSKSRLDVAICKSCIAINFILSASLVVKSMYGY